MSNTFTLDALKEEIRQKFEPFTIGLSDGTQVHLLATLRLSEDARKALSSALDEIGVLEGADDSRESLDSAVEAISRVFTIITDRPQKLLADLHDDDQQIKLMLMSRVLNAWAKATQLGEA